MNSTNSHPKKSPSSNRRRRGNESLTKTNGIKTPESLRLLTSSPTNITNKSPVGRRCRAAQNSRSPRSGERKGAAQQCRPTTLRQEFRTTVLPAAAWQRRRARVAGVFMRHWLNSLLGLERPDLHRCRPMEFSDGRQLPPGLHPRINRRGFIRDLLPNPRAWDAAQVTRHFRWAWLTALDNGKIHAAKPRR